MKSQDGECTIQRGTSPSGAPRDAPSMIDITRRFASPSGGISPVGYNRDGGELLQYLTCPEPARDFQHVDLAEDIPVDPALTDAMALAHSPLGSSGALVWSGATANNPAAASGMPFYPPPPLSLHGSSSDMSSYPPPLLSQRSSFDMPFYPPPLLSPASSWSDTAASTSAWIADTDIPGMWSQQSALATQHPYIITDPLQEADQSHLLYGATTTKGTLGSAWLSPSATTSAKQAAADSSQTLPGSIGSSSTGGGSASPEKPKRRRGRPRLYGDDGTEIPKQRPSRPQTYGSVPVPESVGSGSSKMLSRSPTLVGDSITVGWGGSSAGEGGEWSRPARGPKRIDLGEDETEHDATEASRQAAIRSRNKAAATRYRAKTQEAVERMEAEEREVNLRRRALLAAADQLRGEVYELKTEVMQHANCGCPLISRYLSDATHRALEGLTGPSSSPMATHTHTHAYQPQPMLGNLSGIREQAFGLHYSQGVAHDAGCPSQQQIYDMNGLVPSQGVGIDGDAALYY